MFGLSWMQLIPRVIMAVVFVFVSVKAYVYKSTSEHYKARYEQSELAFKSFRENAQKQVEIEAENHQKALAFSLAMLEQAEKQYSQEKSILLDQVKRGADHAENVTNELVNERNLNRMLQDRLRASLAERKAIAAYSEGLAESWRECDSASARSLHQYTQDLELATAKTTSDFNLCRRWMDEACTLLTCGDE